MDDAVVSQEEIDALLGGGVSQGTPEENLSDNEKDAIGEISNISMGTAATTLSTLVNNKVVITTPKVSISDLGTLSKAYDRPCVFIQIGYIEGLDGKNVLILKENDVKIITDLMMGGDGTNLSDELSDLHLSAICEAMNQMMGSASTSLSSMLEKKVDISPPTASLLDLNDSISTGAGEAFDFLDGQFVMVSFRMQIGDLIDSQIMQLYSFAFAKDLYNKFMGDAAAPAPEPTPPPAQSAPTPPPPAPAAPAPEPMPQMQMQPQPMPQMQMQPQPMPQMQMPMYAMPPMDYNVQPAQFQSFNPAMQPLLQQENIDLILDVPLEVSVELGRTNKTIKEILDFQQGSIIELNRLAGEPIDVLVNGKFVAKGEVVVIEENFGIRVTEIIK